MIPPVSHSHLAAFEQCPRKYHHTYILKDVPWETSPQMEKGKNDHKALQEKIENGYLRDKGYICKAELKLGMTANGAPCDFFSPHVAIRGVADVVATREEKPTTATLLDWKTGKRREDPFELQIHGLLVRAHNPIFENIFGHYVWLAEQAVGPQHDLSETWKTLEKINGITDKIQHQLAMGYMPPKQSPLCEWCRVKSCEYNPRIKSQSGHQKVSA